MSDRPRRTAENKNGAQYRTIKNGAKLLQLTARYLEPF